MQSIDAAIPPEQLLNAVEAARLLKVHPRTLSNWRGQRTGPSWVRVGRCVRYMPRIIAAWMASRSVGTMA